MLQQNHRWVQFRRQVIFIVAVRSIHQISVTVIKFFLKKHEKEVASKVWRGALEVGVEVNLETGAGVKEGVVRGGTEVECILEIQDNEKRDKEERSRREQHKTFHP
ncbi:hypothetical protein A2U01_0013424 [Trifolium medium]|uniref:Uncharacterized protein n=1 Tax=Trifolium medium TaxID=97028 RepID=A0A392N1W3_9FABA|nr:hypothetical protein [Trifolium medium]